MKKDIGYYTNSRSEVYNKLVSDIQFTRMLSSEKRALSLLEFGSGAGAFFQNFNSEKFEYTGVDINREAVSIGQEQNLNITCSNWDVFLNENNKKFDVLVINDFLEHISDHNAFLSKAREALTFGGILVGSVPNLRFSPVLINLLVRRDFKYYSHGVLDETHLRFFTRKSLERTLSENNFMISSLSMLNPIKPQSLKDAVAITSSLVLGADSRFQQIFFVGVK